MKKSAMFFVLLAMMLMMLNNVSATTLSQRVKENNASEVEKLIKSGADVNAKDEIGSTPLCYAALLGFVEIAEKLLNAGAQVDALGLNSMVPLEIAVGKNHAKVVKLLLKKGANPNRANSKNICVLAMAAGAGSVDIVKALINAGADVTKKYADLPAFHMTTRLTGIDSSKRANGLNALLEFGDVNVNEKIGPNEQTALHFALDCAGIEYNYDDIYLSVVEALIKKGADVNAKAKNGLTALYLAVLKNCYKIAELLLKSGASVNEQSNCLLQASQNNNGDIVRLLAEHGADMNLRSKNGYAPLHIAVINNYKKVVEALIGNGADINIKSTDNSVPGSTPLHLAVLKFNSLITSVLVQNNADVDALDNKGKSPLDYAQNIKDDSLKEKIIKTITNSLPEKLKTLSKKLADLQEKIGSLGNALETLRSTIAKH